MKRKAVEDAAAYVAGISGRLAMALALSWILCAGRAARSADWPAWRGAGGDGIVSEPPPASWPADAAPTWKADVGEGHASPIVGDGKVFVFSRSGKEEVLQAFDSATGKPAWRSAYPATYEVNPEAASHGPGPKSTPAYAGGRVFTLGIGGILSCFGAAAGDVVWRKEPPKEFPRTSPLYGTAASPIIVGDLVIANIGGHDKGALRAFDAASGAPRWSWDGDGPGYATPIVRVLAGERQVITQTQNNLIGLSAAEGKLLWKVPFRTEYDQNAVTPLVLRDLVIYSGYDKPAVALRIEKGPSGYDAREAWRNGDVAFYMSSPVLNGERLFGFSHRQKGQLVCLEAATGKAVWKGPGRLGDNAALLSWGPFVLALTDSAEVVVLRAADDNFTPVSRFKAASSPTWASPAVADGRLYVKDRGSVACFQLAPQR
jgi:outer membrane protein assembly factor BamB